MNCPKCDIRALLATQGLHIVTDEQRKKLDILNDPALCWAALEAEMNARGYRFVDAASAKVLEATGKMKLVAQKSTRPPFVEKVVCLGGGEGVVRAELARREKEKRND